MTKHSRPVRYTNWYLRAWMASQKVNQAALVEKTGMNKTAVSLLVNDRQDYSPEIVRDVANALNIAIYELFMHPDDANSLRRLRQDALKVVESSERLERIEPANDRTGTDG